MRRDRVKDLLLFLREQQITWTTITVGDVMIDGGTDLKLAQKLPASRPAASRRESMWLKYGGDVVSGMTTSEGMTTTVIDEDEDD